MNLTVPFLVPFRRKPVIKNIIAFDVYEGDNIPGGKKAYALGFTLLNKNKTLTDEEIDKTMDKLMKAFERAMQKYSDRVNKPVHTVVQYRYTMETSRQDMLSLAQQEKTVAFEKIFDKAENRVHAIFLFLSLLELVQQKFMKIIIGEGKNNFIIEYNEPENRLAELEEDNQPQ